MVFLAAPPFLARETLRAWQEKNYPWLELSNVHRQTTENIRVTVMPFYMGSRVSGTWNDKFYHRGLPGELRCFSRVHQAFCIGNGAKNIVNNNDR